MIRFDNALLDEPLFIVPDTKLTNTPKADNLRYEGQNHGHIIVIYKPLNGNTMTEEFLLTLSNLITACRLTFDDIALINFTEQKPIFTKLMTELYPQKVVAFNMEPADLHLQIPLFYYRQIQIHGATLLFSEAVEKLDKGKKSRLWKELQVLFDVSPSK